MRNQIMPALVALLLATSGIFHPANGQSCSLPETMDLSFVNGISWSCQDKAKPCRPMAELLGPASAGVEKSSGGRVGAYLRCPPPETPQPRVAFYDETNFLPLQSPQALRTRNSRSSTIMLTCFKTAEYIDYAELGTAQIKLEPHELLEVQKVGGQFAELKLRTPLTVAPKRSDKLGETSVQSTVAIIATENALSLAPFAEWETGWGKEPLDIWIDRKILWISISLDGSLKVQWKESGKTFGVLTSYGKPFKGTVPLDGKPVLKNIAEFLRSQPDEDLQKLDYLIFLKEGWDPSIEGVEAIAEQLGRLRPDAPFDIVSTRTITNAHGILQSLATEREGGRYFESVAADRIEIPGQDLRGRVLGRIRNQARDKARALGIELEITPAITDEVAVKLDDSIFELGNLATREQVSLMISILELPLCLSNVKEDEVLLALLTTFSRAGLPFQMEATLRNLFRTWFSGFELPRESPLADVTLATLLREARQPETRALLGKILSDLRKLPGHDTNCSLFVPSSVFLAGK